MRGFVWPIYDGSDPDQVSESMVLHYADVPGVFGGATRRLWLPRYDTSGHSVTVWEPQKFFDDATEFLREAGVLEEFEHYKRIPSLQQYVLVSYRDREIEVWTHQTDGWIGSTSRQDDRAELGSIGSHLVVAEVYDAAEEPNE